MSRNVTFLTSANIRWTTLKKSKKISIISKNSSYKEECKMTMRQIGLAAMLATNVFGCNDRPSHTPLTEAERAEWVKKIADREAAKEAEEKLARETRIAAREARMEAFTVEEKRIDNLLITELPGAINAAVAGIGKTELIYDVCNDDVTGNFSGKFGDFTVTVNSHYTNSRDDSVPGHEFTAQVNKEEVTFDFDFNLEDNYQNLQEFDSRNISYRMKEKGDSKRIGDYLVSGLKQSHAKVISGYLIAREFTDNRGNTRWEGLDDLNLNCDPGETKVDVGYVESQIQGYVCFSDTELATHQKPLVGLEKAASGLNDASSGMFSENGITRMNMDDNAWDVCAAKQYSADLKERLNNPL
jgi:hypothetical protein